MSLIAYPPVYNAKRTIPLHKKFLVAKPKRVKSRAEIAKAAYDELNLAGLRTFRQRGLPEVFREIVNRISMERKVPIMLIAGNSRTRSAVWARNEIMYLIKKARPGLSMGHFAKWFDRDHTSAMHGIASHADRAGLPQLVGYDLHRVRERNAEIAARYRDLARDALSRRAGQ
jgi:hypothetical protein